MKCSTNEALASLFFNVSTSSFLLLLLLYSATSLLLKLFHFIGGYPLLQRSEDEYDSAWCSDEEEEEEEEDEEEEGREAKLSNENHHVVFGKSDHLIADVSNDGESLYLCNSNIEPIQNENEFMYMHEPHRSEIQHDDGDSTSSSEVQFSANDSLSFSESDEDDGKVEDDDDDYDDDDDHEIRVSSYGIDDSVHMSSGPTRQRRLQSDLVFHDKNYDDDFRYSRKIKNMDIEKDVSCKDDKFIVFAPTSEIQRETYVGVGKGEEKGKIIGESSCTNGSTSKSSSEWRSSIKTDDPFSSSSRRSCPKWESYTVFHKYDEEMTFLDQISTQKLQETESLKSFMVEPRSISERIVHKISNAKKKAAPLSTARANPHVELESAYVAQMCLTWEALSWNYTNFEQKRSRSRSSRGRDFDVGCPAEIAEQFRRFQILLQRYIETEPYDHGRRPEIFARVRRSAPKLLLVPEYQEYCDEEEEKDEGFFKSRISSASFLMIMEECIKTFMSFLKADKEKQCHKILKSFFGRPSRGLVDPTLVHLMKKINSKKKANLKDMRREGKCKRKRKLKVEEEMEILMGEIDLKVVSRVLRMRELSEEKLNWCEEKMSKLNIQGKKLQRDPSPLFFPPH